MPVAGAALHPVPAHDVALGRHGLADLELGDAVAQPDDLARELVADHERRLEPPLSPGVPVGDVEVGAAHARVPHGDQHLPGTGGGFPDARDLETRGALLLDDRLHHTGARAGGERRR